MTTCHSCYWNPVPDNEPPAPDNEPPALDNEPPAPDNELPASDNEPPAPDKEPPAPTSEPLVHVQTDSLRRFVRSSEGWEKERVEMPWWTSSSF